MNIPVERHDESPRSRGPRPMTTALIAGVLAASLFALPPVAGAQATGVATVPPLIVFGQERSPDAGGSAPGLTHEQAAALERLRSDPLVSELRLARSTPEALAATVAARALSLPVPQGGEALSFTAVRVEHHDEGMVSLRAGSAELGNSASFVLQGADVLGSFQHDGETWRVDPLGGGLTAVYRYDTSNLLMDPPGWGMRQRLYAPEPTPTDDAGASVEGADTGDTIDLMVVYTPAAAAMGNIDLFIRSALDNTHDSYEKSNIGFRLRLVHKAQVSYAQHPSDMVQDLRRLSDLNRSGRRGANDGYMDEVHDLRDRYGADLVALFVARPASRVCGVAWIPPFGKFPTEDFESLGFSVNARSCETTSGRVFAHEVGHNQGARHDPYNSPGDCPTGPDSCDGQGNFPWRYGRCNTEQGWRTVMAYQSTPNGRCVQSTVRFLSPAVTFRGTPTGDAARRDNRRVLMETARRVANFRQSKTEPPPPPPPPNSLHATLPYVAPAGGGLHPSLVRVLNDSAQPNTVQVTGYDDTGRRFGPVPLSIAAREAATLTSAALESGGSGFAGLGDGAGWWRLELSGERPFRAGMYYRTADGFMAELTAPIAGEQDGSGQWAYDVGFFNPGSNTSKVSRLRLANPNGQAAQVVVAGRDDRGREAPRGTVRVTLPAQGATTLTARALENGGSGFTGRLGDGEGKWRLTVTADRPVVVMSLLHAVQTGHLANLSAIAQGAQGSAPPPPPPPPPEIAPDLVVQSPSVSDGSLNAGARFTLSAEVRNQGGGPSAATTLRYYRSSDATISRSDTPVGTDAVGSLSASGASTEFIGLTAPASAGTYYYGACVDSVTGESNTGNNCSSAVRTTVSTTVNVPDLSVADATLDIFPTISSAIWSMDVHNLGGARSPETTARVRSRGRTLDTDSLHALSPRSIFGFAWGEFTTNLPQRGDRVAFCVDAVPNERNTGNNCLSGTIVASGNTGQSKAETGVIARDAQVSNPQALRRAFEAERARLQAQEQAAVHAQ